MTTASPVTITVYSTSWCSDCHRAKFVLDEYGIDYTEIDVEQTPAAAEIVKNLNNGRQSVPTIVFPDGSILIEPSNAMLIAKIDIGDD